MLRPLSRGSDRRSDCNLTVICYSQITVGPSTASMWLTSVSETDVVKVQMFS